MTRKLFFKSSSILAGLGGGALAMYLFDPAEGRGRRDAARAKAALLAESAHHWADAVAQRAGDWRKYASAATHDLPAVLPIVPAAAQAVKDHAAAHVWQLRDRLAKKAALYAPRARLPIGIIALSTVGALALGASLMYVFDPVAGRQRRERAMAYSRSAGHAVANRTHHAVDRARNLAAQSKAAIASLRGRHAADEHAESAPAQ